MTERAVCVELGGGSTQTVVFEAGSAPRYLHGAHDLAANGGGALLVAVPGIVETNRVVAASNLDWYDVDPVEALGLTGPATLVANDAAAAAVGEALFRRMADLAYLGLGTGIGGAVVVGGTVVATEVFGHRGGYSELSCTCGRTGCLETVAAGWALPSPIPEDRVDGVAEALVRALDVDPPLPDLVVIGGGLARGNPALVDAVAQRAPDRRVEGSLAPAEAKSAAPWGLLQMAGLDGLLLRPESPAAEEAAG